MYSKAIFLVASCLLGTSSAQVGGCADPNAEMNDCGNPNPMTCFNKDFYIEFYVCLRRPRCRCKTGFVEDYNRACIPAADCEINCGGDPNAEPNTSGDCPKTCLSPDFPPDFCPPGQCACKDGYLKDLKGRCIEKSACSYWNCGLFEILSKNGNCRFTCAASFVSSDCIMTPGCTCEPGMLRNDKGRCIRDDTCDSPCDGDPLTVLSPCGFKCERTCENIKDLNWSCTNDCDKLDPVCICGPDLVRNSQGQCIPPEDCVTCPGSEIWTDCANCQKSCNNWVKSPKCVCKPGCTCPKGQLRNSKGKCVAQDKCDPPCQNDKREVFTPYGDQCERTCKNIKDKNWKCKVDKTRYEPKCACHIGYVRNAKNVCVKPEECKPLCGSKYELFFECPDTCTPQDPTCEMYMRGEEPVCEKTKPCDCKPGCWCFPGNVRNNEGQCVPPQECCTDPNSYFTAAGSPCPGGTCDLPEFEDCDKHMAFTCQCNDGYLKRSEDDPTCIPIEECPKKTCDD